jgi:Zn-dependent M28 family amino/carboxypeptidase
MRFAVLAGFLTLLVTTARAQVIPYLDGDAAMELLKKQCAFGPRVPGTLPHAKTRDFLATTLKKYTDDVRVQSFPYKTGGRTLTLSNIVAVFGSAKEPGVLLCAHWDTRPFADKEKDSKRAQLPIPGANDGASGVAVLLEVARRLHAVPPPVPVAIVFFDGEDWGKTAETMFLGSRYYAKNPIPWKPRYGILLDMVGDKNLQLPIEAGSLRFARSVVSDLWGIAAQMGIVAFQQKVGYEILDDHVFLSEAGIPCVNIIDFDYPPWHTLEDTPDKCSAESLRKVGDVLLRFTYTRTKP